MQENIGNETLIQCFYFSNNQLFMSCVEADIIAMKNDAAIFVVFPNFVDNFWQINF